MKGLNNEKHVYIKVICCIYNGRSTMYEQESLWKIHATTLLKLGLYFMSSNKRDVCAPIYHCFGVRGMATTSPVRLRNRIESQPMKYKSSPTAVATMFGYWQYNALSHTVYSPTLRNSYWTIFIKRIYTLLNFHPTSIFLEENDAICA